MSYVAGLPTTPPAGGFRTPVPRQVQPPSRVDRPVDPRSPSYRQVERAVEQEQADGAIDTQPVAAPTGVEPVSTQSVLHLRSTAAPVSRIAEAYGLAPAAVRRMLRATAGATDAPAAPGGPGLPAPGGPGLPAPGGTGLPAPGGTGTVRDQ